MNNKNWTQNDFRKLYQTLNKEDNQRQLLKKIMDKKEAIEILHQELKKKYKGNHDVMMDVMSEFYETAVEQETQMYIDDIFEEGHYQTKDEAKRDIEKYCFFKNVLEHLHHYSSHHGQEFEDDKAFAQYLLAWTYKFYKGNKNDYFQKEQHNGKLFHTILDAYFENDHQSLQDIYEKFQSMKDEEELNRLHKRIIKVITKARKQLQQIENNDELEILKMNVLDKVEHIIGQEDQLKFPEIQEFLDECAHKIFHQVHQDNEKQESLAQREVCLEDLAFIEKFYSNHHIYFKRTQINDELSRYPFLIDFYHYYDKVRCVDDDEKKMSMYEELISDIKESGLKKLESLRRLLSIATKEIESIVDAISEMDIEKDEIITLQLEQETLIRLGKFSVIQDSLQDNPVNVYKIVDLLAEECREKRTLIEEMIYEIGFDKVHGYLLKCPGLTLEDLQAIVKLDRSLRYEYQRLLEDIELYFRSSLSYFLTNKYDQKYLMEDKKHYYYSRGYLMKTKFMDEEEHYEHIKQLRDRLDNEIKNNNRQIIQEFHRYNYAVPLYTATGIMPFGWIINLFENLNYYDKSEYLNTYYQKMTPQTFGNWLMSLGNLRNICAHYQSLYRLSSLKELKPIVTKDQDSNGFDDDFKHSSFFYYTLVMTRLSPNRANVEDFIDDLGILFRKAEREMPSFDLLNDYSFPSHWRMILENEKSCKIHRRIHREIK